MTDFASWMGARGAGPRPHWARALLPMPTPCPHTLQKRSHALCCARRSGQRPAPLPVHAAGEVIEARAPRACVMPRPARGGDDPRLLARARRHAPRMDDDDLRRAGRPCTRPMKPGATAPLVGDALQTQAFIEVLAQAQAVRTEARLKLAAELAAGIIGSSAGARPGGRAIDHGDTWARRCAARRWKPRRRNR
ncbi:hypothetical protein ACTMU2_32685 [Cupriavidus basilensis]